MGPLTVPLLPANTPACAGMASRVGVAEQYRGQSQPCICPVLQLAVCVLLAEWNQILRKCACCICCICCCSLLLFTVHCCSLALLLLLLYHFVVVAVYATRFSCMPSESPTDDDGFDAASKRPAVATARSMAFCFCLFWHFFKQAKSSLKYRGHS